MFGDKKQPVSPAHSPSQKQQPAKGGNLLLSRPRQLHKNWRQNDSGHVELVFQPEGRIEQGLRWLTRKPLTSYLELDELGSAAWLLMDGETTVHEIIGAQCLAATDNYESMQQRTVQFLKILVGKGLVTCQ